MASKIGFIGLGQMGSRMCANLLKKGNQVVAFDVMPAALDKAKGQGAEIASCPADVAAECGTLVTMLPSNGHVKQVYLGDKGILATLQPGSFCVDSSTIDPAVSREVSKSVRKNGSDFVDAPVSGGVGGAEAGTLTFMVGGSPESYERSKELLSFMGKNIVHCGGVGTGQVAKLCNNMILAISMIGVSEGMNLGVKLGMDRKTLAGILNTSTARCWSSDTYNPAPGVMEGVPSSREYEGGFGSQLMLKDLGLVSDAARSVGAPIPLGEASHAFYQLLVNNNLGAKDFSVAYKFLGGLDQDPPKKL